ncbi:MAG: hypothetical protein RKO24_02075 [Candidatus Competibacter sp.]|nr:hypothetical protein [Candidatus Competibacter sp.]
MEDKAKKLYKNFHFSLKEKLHSSGSYQRPQEDNNMDFIFDSRCPVCGQIVSTDICTICNLGISKCPECKETIFDKENICPYCGFLISKAKLKMIEYSQNLAGYFFIIGIAIFMISIISNSPMGIFSGMTSVLIGFFILIKPYIKLSKKHLNSLPPD